MVRPAERPHRLRRILPRMSFFRGQDGLLFLLTKFGERRFGVLAAESTPGREPVVATDRPAFPPFGQGGFVLAPPQTDPLDYHRLLQLVARLRGRCQELFDGVDAETRWKCSPIRVRRKDRGQSFELTSDQAAGIRVTAEVLLRGKRGLVFRVVRHRQILDSLPEDAIEVPLKPLAGSSTKALANHCIDALRDVLRGCSPGKQARPKRLAAQLQMWDELLETVEQVWGEVPQLDRADAVRANRFDVELAGSLPESGGRIGVSMKLMNWAELGESPCWIVLRPGDDASPRNLPSDLTPVRRGPNWYVPVPLSVDPEVFAKAFKSRLKRALQCCGRE